MEYKRPLVSGDRFVVETRVKTITAAKVILAQDVYLTSRLAELSSSGGSAAAAGATTSGGPSGAAARVRREGLHELVLVGEAVVVFLDAAYRPMRVPAAVKAVLEQVLTLTVSGMEEGVAGAAK